MKGHDRERQWHQQAADDQGSISGKAQWAILTFSLREARFFGEPLLRFPTFLNNPWNLAGARHKARPEGDNKAQFRGVSGTKLKQRNITSSQCPNSSFA